jgi:hypothetical protein
MMPYKDGYTLAKRRKKTAKFLLYSLQNRWKRMF